MKTLHTVVAVVGIAAAGSAARWYQHNLPEAGSVQKAGAAASAPAATNPGGLAAVEVARATVLRLEDDAVAVGSLRSKQGVMLRPEVAGRVARLGFKDGQRVRRGQLLVQLDDTLPRAQLQQAQAQASIARTNLQRNRELLAQNFVSASAVDQSAAALEVAEAQVALARAQVERMRIVAPFDGVAGIAAINLGDYVKDGADLVNIEDASSMSVDFRLPERYLARLKAGQPVDVQVDALPGRSFQGRIDAVDSQVDAQGRALLVRARLPNPKGELKAGMFARARTVFAVREQAVVVPEEALVPQGGKQYLIKVADGPSGKVSQRLEARIGLRLPGRVEILEGLAQGDLVVTAGRARLMRGDGLPLTVVEVGSGAAPAASAPARAASALRPPV
ncbi:efflux RND transporter periplasmic adaptor subunit [Piscinibacter aquaticus]|uniref:Efflux RND transporter periplasmic adaptor subunit n=1 Tax=Piscinibacter aquaticus TaxID=392597 RepID=A0A5C6TZT0_9BURK|nr:efflux RND transporter periplasmic adaptor subunit [Piscinibacter aquaticus]